MFLLARNTTILPLNMTLVILMIGAFTVVEDKSVDLYSCLRSSKIIFSKTH